MKSLRRKLGFGFLLLLSSVQAGSVVSSGAPNGSDASYAVTIKDFGFSPQTLEVPLGATITWTNKDEEPHTVTQTKGLCGSPTLDTNDQFVFESKTAGNFDYYCKLHPHMTGKIIVSGGAKP
jgi:plastocyanin